MCGRWMCRCGTSGITMFDVVHSCSQVYGVLSDDKETGRRATGECTTDVQSISTVVLTLCELVVGLKWNPLQAQIQTTHLIYSCFVYVIVTVF